MRSILVVYPVGPNDNELALQTLRSAAQLDETVDAPILIVVDRGQKVDDLVLAAGALFERVAVHEINPCPFGQVWPRPQTWAWQQTAKWIGSKRVAETWFWWEPDAIPVRKGWFNTLRERHVNSGRPFSGPVVTNSLSQTYMAGVAFYPMAISRYCYNALMVVEQPFDIVASVLDGIMDKHVHDMSDLIEHVPTKANTEFFNKRDISLMIPKTAVLFHKCKDGSLGEVMSGKRRQKPKIGEKDSVPSFTEQTKWPSGYFAFPVTEENAAYYNCSILRWNGKLHLFARRHTYGRDPNTGRVFEGYGSQLSIFRVRENMTLEWPNIVVRGPQRWDNEQWEDPRAYLSGNKVFVSMATWVHFKNWKIRQSMVLLSDDFRSFDVMCEPAYGGNSPIPDAATGHEKNWVWFEQDGTWFCQYSINPMVVLEFDKWKIKNVHSNTTRELGWKYGLLRGGTPLTKVGDELIGFFHSALPWREPKRRYYVGAYAMDSKPPFSVKRITKKPLLIGSDEDFRVLGGPLVLFPNGAILEKETWTVVFGVNDEHCGWIRIPHSDLDKLLNPAK